MKSILVIEDNENNMELISFILENAGYEVTKAYNGKDGIRQTIENQPDVVLLDIQLPDIDGLEVLKEIRDSGLSELPVIAVTSYAMTGDSKKIIDAGCNGYIEKPIDALKVTEKIESILANI